MSEPNPERTDATPVVAPEIADDGLQIRIFTIADHAAIPPDGKIYVSGGGIDQILMTQMPGLLGSLWLAIRIHVPWGMTSDSIPFRIRALDGDRNPVGPDPFVAGNAEIGRAPGQRPGDEVSFSLAVPIGGLEVKEEGHVYFHLEVNGDTLGVLPVRTRRAPAG